MAAVRQGPPPIVRCDSPPPDTVPEPALGSRAEFGRCLSTASTVSHASATTDGSGVRDSLGSDFSAISRQSSGSYQSSRLSDLSYTSHALRSKTSTGSLNTVRSGSGSNKRRGYSRPQGTDFAASARSRESVLSLGSIAHLQYYFARTGLLDGKGGQLARKRKGQTLDLSALDTTSFLSPRASGSDHDSSYASMGSSPDLAAHNGFLGVASMVESPVQEHYPGQDDEYSSDEFDEPDPNMLPPTVSTYNYREKPISKPPTVAEMKADLTSSLDAAAKALSEAKDVKGPSTDSQPNTPTTTPQKSSSPGWHEIQGMHILDVMTLAIRAAKIYYTTHDRPDRLDAIKPEKAIRSDLLSVMDVLKRMATRGFVGGLRPDEHATMTTWIASLRAVLAAEAALEAAELAERRTWTWLAPEPWINRPPHAREEAFLRSLLSDTDLPAWTPVDAADPGPTPFLEALKDGTALVQAHNAAVRRSRRRFGEIPAFHRDTQKPYRAAENLRYWIKAAELRWEVLLRADVLGLQYNTDGGPVWAEFEGAVLGWCGKVREEMIREGEDGEVEG